MLFSFVVLGGVLTMLCAPGLIAMSVEDRRRNSNEGA